MKRSDGNQASIVHALREIGATVTILSEVGHGCPDALVGWAGKNFLIEIKNPQGRGLSLTPDELRFHDQWRGQVNVITSFEDALRLIGAAGGVRIDNGLKRYA